MALLHRRRRQAGLSTAVKCIPILFVFTSFAIFVLNVIFISHHVNSPSVVGSNNNIDSSLNSFIQTSVVHGPSGVNLEKVDPIISTVTTLSLPTHKRFAYAFFATDEAYACGAFVNVASLRETGTRNETEFVILTFGFDTTQVRKQALRMHVIIKNVEHLAMPDGGNGYYQNVMVKLRVFQLFEYDRIIFMDSDMMVRKNLDHLFFLPDTAHIAGPRVYFQQFDGRPNFFCSCLMVFTPHKHMWDRIMSYYDEGGKLRQTEGSEFYDMDLLNKEFVDEATILPGIYEVLTAHLESEGEWRRCLKDLPFMEKKLGMPGRTWEEIYNATSLMHFTGIKPTNTRTLDAIKQQKGGADPRFFAIYERYFSIASTECPFYPEYSASDIYSHYFTGEWKPVEQIDKAQAEKKQQLVKQGQEGEKTNDNIVKDGQDCGSCYGAGDEKECCNTCDDVKRAYERKSWQLTSFVSILQCSNN